MLIFRLIPLIFKNLARSGVRFFATTFGCVIAAFIVSFFFATDFSVGRVMRQAESSNLIIVSQLDKHCPATSMLNDAEIETYAQLPQVADILPTKVIMTDCGSSGDTIVVHGIDKEKLLDFRQYKVANEVLTMWQNNRNGAIIGEQIAKRYNWKIGEQVSVEELGGISFVVCGVFHSASSSDGFLIVTDRDYLQQTQRQQGISSLVWIKLNPGYDVSEAIQAIEKVPMTAHVSVKLEKAHIMAALEQFNDLLAASKYLVLVILLIILVAIGNAVSMSVRERIPEFAIMRTIGYSRPAVWYMVLCDSLIVATIGVVIGCCILQGIVWGNVVRGMKFCDINIVFASDVSVWFKTMIAVVGAALIGAVLPARTASHVNILEGIRKED